MFHCFVEIQTILIPKTLSSSIYFEIQHVFMNKQRKFCSSWLAEQIRLSNLALHTYTWSHYVFSLLLNKDGFTAGHFRAPKQL